jgi:hypothetical protein
MGWLLQKLIYMKLQTTIKVLTEKLELFKKLNTEGEKIQIGNYTEEIKELEKVISVLNNGVIVNYDLILKEVYSGIGLETNDKEFFGICMRDSGFEFTYEGGDYSAQKGIIKKLGGDSEELTLNGG